MWIMREGICAGPWSVGRGSTTRPGWWSELDEFASPVDKPTPIEDVHIFLPLLVDEFEGNEDAARAAWALGVRPADYPQEEQP